MGKRADVVLLLSGVVFVINLKSGQTIFIELMLVRHSIMRWIFVTSMRAATMPTSYPYFAPLMLLVALPADLFNAEDGVSEVLFCNGDSLVQTLETALFHTIRRPSSQTCSKCSGVGSISIQAYSYNHQAAQALYKGHDVKEISRSDAGAYNLSQTTSEIIKIIESSKQKKQKSICFVTGVPGAGKTLAGLNVATKRLNPDNQKEHAVFLSGNGPLVSVLREALARDEKSRQGTSKGEATRHASTFIQNIHHFRDDNLKSLSAPVEQVVIFDEAQRAWDKENTSRFMQSKKNQPGFNKSEPEFLIEVMDRHTDWHCYCAIGGGQRLTPGGWSD